MPPGIGLAREAWGPRFWKVLHTLAERSGQQRDTVSISDEGDLWIHLLKAQAQVMPCATCKQHFLEWHITHKIDILKELYGEDRRVWIRGWLWGCHTRVNELNKKNSPRLEALPELYPHCSIEKEVAELDSMFRFAIEKGQVAPEYTKRWKLALGQLRLMYGL